MIKWNDPATWVGIAAFLGSAGAGIAGAFGSIEWLAYLGGSCAVISAAMLSAVTAYKSAQVTKQKEAEAEMLMASTPTVSIVVDASDADAIANVSDLIKPLDPEDLKIGGTA